MPSPPWSTGAVRARRAWSRSSEESDRTGRSRPARYRERSFAMSAIGIIATLRVQPDKTEAFEGVFAELAAAVRANEPGNSLYRLFHTDEAGVYKDMECYDAAAAVEAHRASDHFPPRGDRTAPPHHDATTAHRQTR